MSLISRIVFWLVGLSGFAFALVVSFLMLPVWPEPNYRAAKGELARAIVLRNFRLENSRIEEIRLDSTSGLSIDLALRIPDKPLPGRPLLIMLAGQETGRKAVEVLPDTRGVTVAALGYPFGVIPHRDGLAMAQALPRIQRGILDTPAGVMLAIDHLQQRKDLVPDRVELAGISFGAFIAAIPATLDLRVDRLWLIHGSGDPQGVIEAGLESRVPGVLLRKSVAWLLATTAGAHHLRPELWVGSVSPRPLVVVNALNDSALPPDAVRLLHESLASPFEILWSPGDHVHPKRPETIEYITELMFRRISAETDQSIYRLHR